MSHIQEIPESIKGLGDDFVKLWLALPEFVTRKVLHETARIFSPGTMANLDSLGKGPSERKKMGKRVCYPRTDLVTWLASYQTSNKCGAKCDNHI